MLHTFNLQLRQNLVIKTQTINLNLILKMFLIILMLRNIILLTLNFQQMWLLNKQN